MNEKEKYETIKELIDHKGNKNRVVMKLGISQRQIDRLIIKYKESGKNDFIHDNRSKKPANAFDKSISEDIILLYKTLSNEGILSPKAKKKTKRELEVFVSYFNKKFNSVFEKSSKEEKLNYTLAIFTPRKIDNGNSIKYMGKYYQQYLHDTLKCFISKTSL